MFNIESENEKPSRTFIKKDAILLFVILCIALALRLYKVNIPLADWHSWRQVDTAAVARNFATGDFNVMLPRYDDLSSIQSGTYNPEGYRFVEFPLYNAIFGAMYKYLPIVPVEVYGRLTTILFSLIIISIIYYFALREHSRIAAIGAAIIYSTFPFFVYYSRVVLPETTAISFVFMAIFIAYLWAQSKQKFAPLLLLISGVCAALSILVKPTVIFYFLPIAYAFFIKYRFKFLKKPAPYVYLASVLVPFILWRMWISKYPEGIPGFEWLLTSVNTYEGQKMIFFRPAFFRWILHERILLLIMGGYGALLPILGLIEKSRKTLLVPMITLAAFTYLLTFQGGNVQHDYYQTVILPALALLGGIGIARLLHSSEHNQSLIINIIVVIFIVGFSWTMSFYKIKDYYLYSEDLVNIGKIIQTLTPPNSKIVTDRDGDTTLLYLANRKGMPAVIEDLGVLKEKGMQYFYTGKGDVAKEVRKIYTPIFENSNVFIFKL